MNQRYRLRLLGPAQFEHLDQPLRTLDSRKGLALLAYLARHTQPIARQQLADLLWGETSEARSRRNLSRELSEITAQFCGCFQADYHTLRWAAADAWVDTAAFQELLASAPQARAREAGAAPDKRDRSVADPGRLAEAVALYRGEFMASFYLNGCPDFESWLVRERELWRRLVTEALEQLIELYALDHQLDQAQCYARRWLELEPWQEQAHRSLMLLLARSGRRSDALAQYEACRHALADELDAEPTDETRALYEQIRTNQLQTEPDNLKSTIYNLQLHDWGEAPEVERFYGRENELATLQCWLVDQRCRLVTLLGMGGMGKTLLAAHVARDQARHYDAVIWRSLLNAPPLGAVVRDCLVVLSEHQVIDLPEQLDSQLQQLLRLLSQRRCLLVLDNYESILEAETRAGAYHPGYEAYGQLLKLAAETAHKSCVLLTSREQPQGLALLRAGHSHVQSLQLAGLSRHAGQALLEARGIAAPLERAIHLVDSYSGNPLALLLVAEAIQSTFGGDMDAFVHDAPLIFDDIRDVLDQQWARLTALEHDLMLWLAVEREAITPEQLQQNVVGGVTRQAVLEALRSLTRRSLVVQQGSGFTLQNVVLEYVTNRLSDRICDEIICAAPIVFNSHALIKAQAKEYVRESQTRMILQPVAERLLACLGRDELERRLQRILRFQRNERPGAPGYAGGNTLNLLLHLGYDLRGYDFSRLCVWQAYLCGAWLPQVNFADADVTGSVFTNAVHTVEQVAWSPDGRLVALAGAGGEIRLRRTSDWQLAGVCTGHVGVVWTICFSPDSRQLASGGEDRTVRLWDTQTFRSRGVLAGHDAAVAAITWGPDGTLIASAGGRDKTIRLWDAASGIGLGILAQQTHFAGSVAFSPDGALLASCSDCTIQVWDCRAWQSVLTIVCESPVWLVSFHASGTLLAGALFREVRLWNIRTAAVVVTIESPGPSVHYFAWNPNQPLLAVAFGHSVWLWDEQTGQMTQTLHGHTDGIRSLCWSGDGERLATWGNDALRIWSVKGEALMIMHGFGPAVFCVAVSSDGTQIAAGYVSGLVQIWDTASWEVRYLLRGHSGRVDALAFSPDGAVLACGSTDHTVTIWDTRSGRLRQRLHGHRDGVKALVFRPDGRAFATGSDDGTVRLWRTSDGQLLYLLEDDTGSVRDVAFHPDGMLLASASYQHTIHVWNADTGATIAVLCHHDDQVGVLAFDPTGRYLASAEWASDVRIWDAATGEVRCAVPQLPQGITRLAYSPDGMTLLTCGHEDTAHLWNVASGEACLNLRGHVGWVQDVAWMPNGKAIISGGRDGTVRVWDACTGAVLQVLEYPRPYADMNITGLTGVTATQRVALQALGAMEQ